MPNYCDPEMLLIRRQESEAARKPRPPRRWPSSPRTPAPTVRVAPRLRVPPRQPFARSREKTPPLRLPGTLTAARLKISATLDAAELLTVLAPEGTPRMVLRICLPDRTLTADVAAKGVRKAQSAIRAAGPANIVILLQGRLAAGDVITEGGLAAQPKVAKPKQTP